MKKAICILLWKGNDVLIVSRRNNPQQWGLPGGKVDLGETDKEAAVRELYEETGFSVPIDQLTPVYEAYCGEYAVKTFSTLSDAPAFKQDKALEADEIFTKFAPLSTICAEHISPFAEYNLGLMGKLYACSMQPNLKGKNKC